VLRRLILIASISAASATILGSQAPKGTVLVQSFFSPALGVQKHLVVYLPPSYERRTDRRYPVAYYLHGVSATEADWLTNGEIDRVADSLIAHGMPELILILVDGDDGWATNWAVTPDYASCLADSTAPWRSPTTYCVHSARYEDYMLRDVIPYVDRMFRTMPDRRHRGVAGYSMGGYSAVLLALAHPDVFAAAASHSGTLSLLYAGPTPFAPPPHYEASSDSLRADRQLFPVFGGDTTTWLRRDPAHLARGLRDSGQSMPALYVDVGTHDTNADQNRAFHWELTRLGVPHEYFEWPGVHNWRYWRAHGAESLRWLAQRLSP
jgi:putative tributyrin esterase